jgi:uncharacterized membrane protein YgcG
MSANFNVHHLGHIPFNPDLLLNRNRFRGRPAGFTFNEIVKLYWTVKSFNVAFSIVSFNEINALETFFGAGGTSGGVGGAQAGLSAVGQSIGNQQPIFVRGQTKIFTKYSKQVRKKPTHSVPFEGIKIPPANEENPLKGEDFLIDNSVTPNLLTSTNLKPNEGSLCSAGPVHRLQSGKSLLLIDFSDIMFFRRLYWPKIEFLGASNNLVFTFDPFKAGSVNVNVIGGVSFLGTLIPVYGYSESFSVIPTQLVVAFGDIQIGKRCCDRFYWDGADEDRAEGKVQNSFNNCKEVCKDEPQGVFLKQKPVDNKGEDIASSSITRRGSSSGGGSVGGGGQFGGGGASARF